MKEEKSSGHGGQRDSRSRVVLIADRSSEGDEVAGALRAAGFSVVTSDAIALPERVARLEPFAVLLDLGQPSAQEALDHLLTTEVEGEGPTLVLVGSRQEAERLGLPAGGHAKLFSRPLHAAELVAFLSETASVSAAPASSIDDAPSLADIEAAMLSDFPAIAGLPEVESILPELETSPLHSHHTIELSPEIEALLTASAARVQQIGDRGPSTSAVDVQVPQEMMAVLDELLGTEATPPAPPVSGASARGLDGADANSLATADRPSEIPATGVGTAVGEPTATPGGTQVGFGARSVDAVASPFPLARPQGPRAPVTPPFGASAPASARDRLSFTPSLWGDAPPTLGVAQPGSAPPSEMPASLRDTPLPPDSFAPATSLLSRPIHTSELAPESEPPATRAQVGPLGSTTGGDSVAPLTTLGQPSFAVPEPPPESLSVPRGDPVWMLAQAVCDRFTGALVLSTPDGRSVRRVLMRDGDMVNAASDDPEDSLVHFLLERGDLGPDDARLRSTKLPPTGRHAVAALIANGFLSQDDLWPVLRAHAEWLIARALRQRPSQGTIEREPPERLRAEPNVFGGAAGVEVLIESVRRAIPADKAVAALGGPQAVLEVGQHATLLAESALSAEDTGLVRQSLGKSLADALRGAGRELAAVLYALVALRILDARAPSRRPHPSEPPDYDPLDADAVRRRVRARLALVADADYFALLGVAPSATSYDIRRAYLELRRAFDPNRLLTAATTELRDDVELIVDVIEEAYEILRDPQRRSRYRRALEATR